MKALYSQLKMFGYPDRLEALVGNRATAPVHVRLKPTNVCNHSCWFCAYRFDNLDLGETMRVRDYIPLDKMREIVDDLAEIGVRALTLSGGGEPLVYPYIRELITRAADSGLKIGILSNGARLRGDLAELIATRCAWIRISINAWDDGSFVRTRNVASGEFEKILENIRAFLSLNSTCLMTLSYIVDKEAAPHLYDVFTRFKAVGLPCVKISPVIVSTDRDEQNAYHDEIREQVESQIDRIRRDLVDDRFRIADHYHRENGTYAKEYHRCFFSNLLTVIGADQNIYFCQDKAYVESGLVASLHGRRFKDVWFSEETQNRLRTLDPSRECSHHCVSHQKNLHLQDYLSADREHIDFI